jgi:phage tail-like protein
MDSNGARFWLLAGPGSAEGGPGWASTEDPDRVALRGGRLVLASQAPAPALVEDEALASARADAVPPATDAFGGFTSVRSGDVEGVPTDELLVHLEGALDEVVFSIPHAEGRIDGVAIDADGIVTVAAGGRLHVRDSRTFGDPHEPWRALDLPALDGTPTLPFPVWRVAPRPGGGAWALSHDERAVARWTGRVLRRASDREVAPGTFRPDPETPETVSVRIVRDGLGGDDPAAIAVAPDGAVAVLAWRPGDEARVHLFDAEGALLRRFALAGVRHPFGLAFVGDARIAVLATHDGATVADALVYPADRAGDERVLPVGDRYPLRRHDGAALWVAWDQRSAYGTTGAGTGGARTLRALSLPLRPTVGEAAATAPLDSRRADQCWHRVYVEAVVPPGCGVRLHLAASGSPTPPADPRRWHPHDLGVVPAPAAGARVALSDGSEAVVIGAAPGAVRLWPADADAGPDEGPTERPELVVDAAPGDLAAVFPLARATWVPARSELPNHGGLLGCGEEAFERVPDRAGLFVALIQRARCRSTRLEGRYLHVRATLYGNGRATPEIAALRAWGTRFSYVREYLPELYHEHPQIDGADEPGAPTPADFLERLVSLFEGVLTPVEDAVAEAWQWTDPATAPAEGLDWLAGWVGLTLDPALSEAARRRMISLAPVLARWRGTLRGLQLLLDVVTEGGSARGDVIVLEEWRLRRTWATILGADLTNDADPLLLGLSVDTNSIVGDTLVLGDEHHREFLALFGPGIDVDEADRDAVDAFFESSAHRVTVLVHDGLPEAQRALVGKAVEDGVPAHVFATVRRTSRHFIAGVTALVGVDTRLGTEPPPVTVRLGSSRLGEGDRVGRPGALHPDVEGDP